MGKVKHVFEPCPSIGLGGLSAKDGCAINGNTVGEHAKGCSCRLAKWLVVGTRHVIHVCVGCHSSIYHPRHPRQSWSAGCRCGCLDE